MCGLVAILNKKTYGFSGESLDLFEHLLYIDALRGEDSTGVFAISNSGNVKIAKDATSSGPFLQTKEWKEIRQAN